MPARTPNPVTSRWEWLAAALSATIVLGLVGILLYGGAARSTPPDILVALDSVSGGAGRYVAHFTVRNRGTQTAASVQIEGELRQADSLLESSRATLDYVPGRGAEQGGLLYTRDPRAHSLRIRPTGYERP